MFEIFGWGHTQKCSHPCSGEGVVIVRRRNCSAMGMSKAAPECPSSPCLLLTTATIFAGCYVDRSLCQFIPLTRQNLVLLDKNGYCLNNVLITYSPQVKLIIFMCLENVKLMPCNHAFSRNFYFHTIVVGISF